MKNLIVLISWLISSTKLFAMEEHRLNALGISLLRALAYNDHSCAQSLVAMGAPVNYIATPHLTLPYPDAGSAGFRCEKIVDCSALSILCSYHKKHQGTLEQIRLIKLLLAHGANPHYVTTEIVRNEIYKNITHLALLQKMGNTQAILLLTDAINNERIPENFDIGFNDVARSIALDLSMLRALAYNDFATARTLIDMGADVNCIARPYLSLPYPDANTRGYSCEKIGHCTALAVVCTAKESIQNSPNHVAMLDFLLEHGANPNINPSSISRSQIILDYENVTCLEWLLHEKNESAMISLLQANALVPKKISKKLLKFIFENNKHQLFVLACKMGIDLPSNRNKAPGHQFQQEMITESLIMPSFKNRQKKLKTICLVLKKNGLPLDLRRLILRSFPEFYAEMLVKKINGQTVSGEILTGINFLLYSTIVQYFDLDVGEEQSFKNKIYSTINNRMINNHLHFNGVLDYDSRFKTKHCILQ